MQDQVFQDGLCAGLNFTRLEFSNNLENRKDIENLCRIYHHKGKNELYGIGTKNKQFYGSA